MLVSLVQTRPIGVTLLCWYVFYNRLPDDDNAVFYRETQKGRSTS